MRPILFLYVLCVLCTFARANVNFIFSEIEGTGETRLTITGNGVLDGLNTSSSTLIPSTAFSQSGVDASTLGGISRLNIKDRAGPNADFSEFSSPLTAIGGDLSADYLANDISFSFDVGDLVDRSSAGFYGLDLSSLSLADGFLDLNTDGTAFGSMNFFTGISFVSTSLFSTSFSDTGSFSWSTGGTPGNDTFTIVVVPEPASLPLFVSGCVGLWLLRRKR